jgi:hypothetical protein
MAGAASPGGRPIIHGPDNRGVDLRHIAGHAASQANQPDRRNATGRSIQLQGDFSAMLSLNMPRLKLLCLLGLVGLGSSASLAAANPDPAPPVTTAHDPVTQARDIIWAKEMAIYEGRSHGMVDFYIANASPNFLAWTAGTPTPFRLDKLRAGRAAMVGHNQEIIKTTFRDFSLSGDTAIIYYQNHRSRMPDGTVVDQTYDNIHVWQKTDGNWKVLASMSRPMGPAVGTAATVPTQK